MQFVIDIPQGLKIDFENENWTALTCAEMKNALMNGTQLPRGHGALIDVDALVGKIHGVRSISAVIDAPIIIKADKEVR